MNERFSMWLDKVRYMHKDEDSMLIVPLRELSYEDAKKEIIKYLENAGNRTVHVSEIVEKLSLDIELTAKILYQWRDQMCKNQCAEDRFYWYTSYTCPIIDCIFNNYLVR